MRPLLACLLMALSLPASAQIYSFIDANGNRVFTNDPPQGSNPQAVQLNPTNTVTVRSGSNANNSTAPATNTTTATAPFTLLQLTGIPSDEAMRANNGTFSVSVATEPALSANQQLQLILDGQAYGQPSSSPSLQLSNLPRGEHSLAVQVLSAGQSIQQSDTVTFTVQRVNTQSPALRPRPTPRPAN